MRSLATASGLVQPCPLPPPCAHASGAMITSKRSKNCAGVSSAQNSADAAAESPRGTHRVVRAARSERCCAC
eukprot:5950953-Prymnesium_polylepis.2